MAMAATVLQTQTTTVESSFVIEAEDTKDAIRTAVSHVSMCNSKGASMCEQQSMHALCVQLKQANLLCLQVHTWQRGVG